MGNEECEYDVCGVLSVRWYGVCVCAVITTATPAIAPVEIPQNGCAVDATTDKQAAVATRRQAGNGAGVRPETTLELQRHHRISLGGLAEGQHMNLATGGTDECKIALGAHFTTGGTIHGG